MSGFLAKESVDVKLCPSGPRWEEVPTLRSSGSELRPVTSKLFRASIVSTAKRFRFVILAAPCMRKIPLPCRPFHS